VRKLLLIAALLVLARPAAAQSDTLTQEVIGNFVVHSGRSEATVARQAQVEEDETDQSDASTLAFTCVITPQQQRIRAASIRHHLPLRGTHVPVTWRFDNGPEHEGRWEVGPAAVSVPEALVPQFWAEADTALSLTVQVPWHQGKRTYRFEFVDAGQVFRFLACAAPDRSPAKARPHAGEPCPRRSPPSTSSSSRSSRPSTAVCGGTGSRPRSRW